MVVLAAATPASADVQWRITSEHGPQNMPPGGNGMYALIAQNMGDADANTGADLTISDTLPTSVSAQSDPSTGTWDCSGTPGGFPTPLGGTVTCTDVSDVIVAPTVGVAPPDNRGMAPVLYLPVSIDPTAAGTVDNQVTVSSEGGAATASTTDATTFSSTPAGFGLNHFLADVFDGSSVAANPVRQAGSHPSEARFDLDFNLAQTTDGLGTYTEPDELVKTVDTTLPAGFVANPEATPKCTVPQLTANTSIFAGLCPPSTQVGTVSVLVNNLASIVDSDQPNATQDLPVYNMVPPKGAVADFAFALESVPVHIIGSLDPADHYALHGTISYTTPFFPIRSAHLTLWGVPADPSHDALRYQPSGPFFGTSSDVAPAPFLTLPSQCDTPTQTGLTIDSRQHPGDFKSYVAPPATSTGCEQQVFTTAIHVAPTTTKADSPSGLNVKIDVNQNEHAIGLGTPPLKQAVVTLPDGLTVSPSSADGLAACTQAQIGLGTNDEPACPDASKIGTATLDTPLLPDTIEGSVYLAAQGDNPFGSLIGLYIVLADKDRGLLVKLPGKVELDQTTGRVTTTFDDNPQIPFSKLTLSLKTGPRAPLVTPMTCGVKTSTAQLTSWNSQIPASTPQDSFTISRDGHGAPCPGQGFSPGFKAGTTNPGAGKDAPFTMTLTRQDGDQELQGLELSLPPGLLGRISAMVLCPDGAATAGKCEDVSRIGSVTVGAGPGTLPFYITAGRVYLTGPYKGAPFGLSIVVPAIAGPFNLGNVVVRAAVFVDRSTAAVKIVSDPLPTILQGIPLQVRIVNVTADRPGFFFNPTNCTPTSIGARITGTGGTVATVSARFQVGECAALVFKPKLSFSVGGKGHTGKGASVPLSATVRMPKGGANLRAVSVTLPSVLNARLPVVNRACTRAQFESGRCEGARAGSAVAVTPLLRDPLRGGVYFVKGKHVIPDLIVALRGQVAFDVSAGVTIPGGKRLGTKFASPDVPLTRFTLRFVSGKNGPLGAATNLCTAKAKAARAAIGFRAQNGTLVKINQRLHINGCPKK